MAIQHVTILGAGWTGLSAAWRLQQEGVQTLVLEQDTQIGGQAKTVVWEGFQLETGPPFFFTSEQLLLDAMRELMGGSFQVRLRQERVWFEDRWIPYPLNTRSLFKLPWATLVRGTAEYLALLLGSNLPGGRWVLGMQEDERPGYGTVLDQLLMSETFKQAWGQAQQTWAPSWTSTRGQKKLSLGRLRRLLAGLFRKPQAYTESFHRPSDGLGSIPQQMREKVEALGGEVKTHVCIRRILIPDGEVREIAYSGAGEHRQKTDYILVTWPTATLLPLLDPLPEHALIEAAFGLRYRGFFYLNLLLDGEGPTSLGEGPFFFPEQRYSFFRARFAKATDERHSRGRRRCLTVEWMLEPEHPLYRADTQAFLDACLDGLEATGLLQRHEIHKSMLHREAHVGPAPNFHTNPDAQDALRRVQAYLTGVRRLRLIGRQANFQEPSLPRALRQGFQAARSLIDETYTRRPVDIPVTEGRPADL